ncbi:hypothetical protein P168DRAFT_235771, partial [Aspergillus campestris IBT 28561]
LQWCQAQDIRVTLRWIPTHEGISGNEEVDELAKQAALRGVALARSHGRPQEQRNGFGERRGPA